MDEPKKPKSPTQPAHQPGTGKGEEVLKHEGKEPRSKDTPTSAGVGDPAGKTDLDKDKAVGTQAPVDPNSPQIPAP
jgi:hypothetical protein